MRPDAVDAAEAVHTQDEHLNEECEFEQRGSVY